MTAPLLLVSDLAHTLVLLGALQEFVHVLGRGMRGERLRPQSGLKLREVADRLGIEEAM